MLVMLLMLKWMLEQQLIQVDGNFGGGSVVIDALFDIAPIVCGDCVFRPWFVMHGSHVISFLVLQSS